MKTELLGQEKNFVTIKVELEAEEFTASLDKTVQEMAQQANIPGFRKGHIPRKVLEMRVGKSYLYAESFKNMLPRIVDQVVADDDLETVGAPSLEMEDELGERMPLTAELTFELRPEVSLPELESIEVEKLRPEVPDEMLEDALKELQKRHSTLNTVQRAAEENDVVMGTFTSYLVDSEGNRIEEDREKDGEPQQGAFDLSDPGLRSEVKEALLGKTSGENVSAEFVVDPSYQDKRLAGKKARYDIAINQVQERILPRMTNGFYRQVLNTDFDTKEAFREALRRQMRRDLEQACMEQVISSAIDQIVEKSELEVPDTFLNRQIEMQKQQDEEASKQRSGLSLEEYLRDASISMEQYEREIREKSMEALRRTLVLDEIRKQFNIEVDQAELENEILRIASLYQARPEALKTAFYKNRDQLSRLTHELRHLKIVKFITDKIKVKEVDELTVKTPRAMEVETTPAERGE
jgi:trigger factor